MLDRQIEYRRMAGVEERHWWYRSLHELVLGAIKGHPLGRKAEIVDVGCGTGGLLMRLRQEGYEKIRGFDLSGDGIRYCRDRDLNVFRGDISDVSALFKPSSIDVMISNDVLCYFQTDGARKITNGMASALKSGGLCLVNLPAFRVFGGIHDISVGIKRRYDLSNLWEIFDQRWFRLLKATYWPLVLSAPIWLVRTLQRAKLKRDSQTEIRSDIDLPPPAVNELLRIAVKLENSLLGSKPFGSSLFLAMKRI